MRIEAIAIGTNPPHDVNVIVEVPVGGQPIKYELDKAAGTLVVDRFLYTPMRYPGNYGFVPHTLSLDGDPIDVLVCNTRPLVPGCVINVRPIGVMLMEDDSGQDEKVLAVPSPHLSRRYEGVHEVSDLPEITVQQDPALLRALQGPGAGKWVRIGDQGDAAQARRLISEAIEREVGPAESETRRGSSIRAAPRSSGSSGSASCRSRRCRGRAGPPAGSACRRDAGRSRRRRPGPPRGAAARC
ncbi:MAG: inorganic diphosphatase [Planctomycetota bacterium]